MSDADRYYEALGFELKRLRSQADLYQKELATLAGLSGQSYQAHELGTRRITLDHLLAVAIALNTQPHRILRPVDQHIFSPESAVRVRLPVLARTDRPELTPARGWAVQRLTTSRGTEQVVTVPIDALARLAVLCELADTRALFRILSDMGALA